MGQLSRINEYRRIVEKAFPIALSVGFVWTFFCGLLDR